MEVKKKTRAKFLDRKRDPEREAFKELCKLAREECANFSQGSCNGHKPCLVLEGLVCDYFNRCVRPILKG